MKSQILLFDQSRSASNLLQRILSRQPSLSYLDHPFSEARGDQVQWLRTRDHAGGMHEALQATFEEKIKDGINKWESALEGAEGRGERLIVHDHPFAAVPPQNILACINNGSSGAGFAEAENFTSIPDSLLFQPGTVVILTIRDPRLAVSSAYRVLRDMGLPHGSGRPNFLISTTPLWHRMLYDFLVCKGILPIVIDADDTMTSAEFVRRLCQKLELDPERALFSWPALSEREKQDLHPMYYASQRTLTDSSGVMPSKAAKNTDLQAEMEGWKKEFGVEDSLLVHEMVELATPHYEYLFQRRWTGSD